MVGASASALALLLDWVADGTFCLLHALILPAAALVTASTASAALALLMISVIVGSRCLGINPDNIATPIAASLGDLVTLSILAYTSRAIYSIEEFSSEEQDRLHAIPMAVFSLLPHPLPLPSSPPAPPLCSPGGPLCLPHGALARPTAAVAVCGLLEQDHPGGGVLRAAASLQCHGYKQVCAGEHVGMCGCVFVLTSSISFSPISILSSLGGLVLDLITAKFTGFALYSPVINGGL